MGSHILLSQIYSMRVVELKIGFRFWPLALGCVCETARRPGFKSRRVIFLGQNIPLSQRLGGF